MVCRQKFLVYQLPVPNYNLMKRKRKLIFTPLHSTGSPQISPDVNRMGWILLMLKIKIFSAPLPKKKGKLVLYHSKTLI
jgi:hypothetical protein